MGAAAGGRKRRVVDGVWVESSVGQSDEKEEYKLLAALGAFLMPNALFCLRERVRTTAFLPNAKRFFSSVLSHVEVPNRVFSQNNVNR